MTTFRAASRRHFLHDFAAIAGVTAFLPAEIAFANEVARGSDQRSVMSNSLVKELRTAFTVQNYAQAVAFYRDAFALPVVQSWDRPEGSGMILDAGRAMLELLSSDMSAYVDHVEAEHRVAGPVRFALDVDDSALAAKKLVAAGAVQIAAPVVTPWNDRNVRRRRMECKSLCSRCCDRRLCPSPKKYEGQVFFKVFTMVKKAGIPARSILQRHHVSFAEGDLRVELSSLFSHSSRA